MFPGKEVVDKGLITARIKAAINPRGLAPIELLESWVRCSPAEAGVLFPSGKCYLWRQHPVHDFKNKLFEADADETRRFLMKRFSAERGDGMDVIVANESVSAIVIGNHDGELFIALEDPGASS